MAKQLAKGFKNIESLALAKYDDLITVDEIGEKIALSVLQFFAEADHIEMIDRLMQVGVQFKMEEKVLASTILEGKAFVVSGVFTSFSRDELKALIETNGGKNVSSISSKTDFVVAGDNMGPAKLEKANKLGVAIISEEDFKQLIGHNL